nr:hypothetical protein B0A51_10867 [Rachicladosporium sp. CCFEE 5018]
MWGICHGQAAASTSFKVDFSIYLEILGVSAATSALLRYFAPSYSIGLFLTTFTLYVTLWTSSAIWAIFIYPRFFSPLRDIPTPSDNRWFYGQTRRIMRDRNGGPQQDWEENIPNDGLIRYSMWFQERLLVTTPKVLGEVLVTKNYEFIKPRQLRNGLGRILGVGILLAEGDEHKRQRKDLMPAFAYRHVKDLYPVFWSKSNELIERLKVATSTSSPPSSLEKQSPLPAASTSDTPVHAPGTIDVGHWASRATLDIIGLSGMGRDFNSLADPKNALNQHYQSVFSPGRVGRALQILGALLPFWFLSRLPVKRNHQMNAASAYIKQTCRELIQHKRKVMQEKGETSKDILSVALSSGNFTDEELVNQMMTFLVAGHETTATSTIWAIFLLCRHPEAQAKLREEVRSLLPSPSSPITATQLDSCHYLHAVCSEVLRLYSPVSMTLRIADKDATLNGHFIPADTTIILAPWAINNSKKLWGEDAHEFKPERWLDADGKANNKGGADSNFSFLTFLHGPRSCIGQKFAQAEFACIVAAWVGTFETTFEENSPLATGEPEIKGGITSKPKGGLWVNLKEVPGW